MKKIAIIITFLFVLPMSAQKQEATLFFKDGTEQSGWAKITNSNKIKFRKQKGAKKKVFNSKELNSILIKEGEDEKEYVYKKTDKHNKVELLRVVIKGKINLFEKITNGYMAGAPMAGGGMSGGHHYSISNYYVSRSDVYNVNLLFSTGTLFGKSFKKKASEYFKDCPSLVKKLQDKVFRKGDLEKIVTYYNEDCFRKKLENTPIKIDSLGFYIKDKNHIIEVPNKSANEIYNKMIEFINKNNHSITNKDEDNFLKFQITNHYISYLTRKGKDGHIGHKSIFEIDFKDGKCIIKSVKPEFYLIFGPILEQPKVVEDKRKKPFKIIGKGVSLYNDNLILSKAGILAKPKMETYFNGLIKNISNFLNDEN